VSVIVETRGGKLGGFLQDSVHVFRGIPYAAPPVGPRRFLPPAPLPPWSGLRDATRFGSSAWQSSSALGPALPFDVGPMDEDCLTLNVWTPGLDGAGRPVLVWIHGGGFVIGAGSQAIYDGTVLARRGDVVVVTLNYRLGVLGFLYLKTLCGERLPATGNEGILDQMAALEWVREEIAAFGGDPAKVTVFGESAGAISVATLLGMPRARGLFRRAILQSGSANFVAPREDAESVSEAFLGALGLTAGTAERLRELPPARLLEAQRTVSPGFAGSPGAVPRPQLRNRLGLSFVPVVDGEVIPRDPFAAIQDGLSRDVAVLIGTTLEEMKLFGLMDMEARTLDGASLLARCERNIPGHGRGVVEAYRQARTARGESVAPPELWCAIETDRIFRRPAMRLAELQRVHQPDVYTYLFTWVCPLMEGFLGACHAIDLAFVFGTLASPTIAGFSGTGPEAAALSERVRDAWVRFARTGNPGHPGLPFWPAYDATSRATMLLGRECTLEERPREAERRVWDAITEGPLQ